MLLCDRVSKGLPFSFIFYFTLNATLEGKRQNTKAKHPSFVDDESENNRTGVGYFDHY